jgi:type VII secretion-associated serine protease mycosin
MRSRAAAATTAFLLLTLGLGGANATRAGAAVARASAPVTTQTPHTSPALRGRLPTVDPNHLLVRLATLRPGLASRLARAGTSIERVIEGTHWTELSTPHRTAMAVRARLRGDTEIAEVHVSYLRRAFTLPNDPYWATAQSSYLSMLRVDRAWDISQGSGITVAVVDTGVDLDHPDLAGRLVAGHNFVNNSSNPQDDVGHGTMVAGIIAADRNNHRGIAGIAPLAKVMPVKVLGSDGTGTDGDIAAGITWATDHGAEVINLSLGGAGNDPVLRDAVAYAIAHDAVVVAAAGNDGAETVGYPASYPGVIAVSATNHGGQLTAFSSWGWRVDIAAPGLDITSTALGPTEAYETESGTSFSSPIVAAVAALVRAHNPGWTETQVRARLLATARDVGPPGVDAAFGHGIVDALAALDDTHPAAPHPSGPVGAGEPNDSPATATSLTVDETLQAKIAPETDEDWYKIPFGATGWFSFDVSEGTGQLDHDMEPIIELYDANRSFLASQDLTGGPLIAPIENLGDYYVRVRNRGGDTANYTIHVAGTTAPARFDFPLELYLGSKAQSVAIGDINGDGRADIAFVMGSSSTMPDTLITLLQTPIRSFVLGDIITTDDTPGTGLAIGDLTGDGKNDIALPTTGGVDVYQQSGGAIDETPTFYATGMNPTELAIGDIDGDNSNDLVVSNGSAIKVFYGPAFNTSTVVTPSTPTHSIAIGDINNDGLPDIVAGGTKAVWVYTQGAGPSFTATSHALTNARNVAVGDLDDDGHDDAAVTIRSTSSGVDKLLQNAGNLGAPGGFNATEIDADPVTIADLNQDGRNDIVVLHDLVGDVGALYQQPGGSLGAEQQYYFDDFEPTYDEGALAAADIDRDGYPDIVVATSFGISIIMQRPPFLPTLQKDWVSDASPANMAVNVATGVTPVLTLDRVANNVDGTTVKLYDEYGNEVAASPTWDGGTDTITVTPNAPLADGAYSVRIDGLQDGSGDELDGYDTTFTVGAAPDETPPQTTLAAPPSGFRTVAATTLQFTSNDGTAVFECSLDNVPYQACTSPIHATVAAGIHTFRVFARDPAGNEDATPAVATWTYRPPPHGYWMLGGAGTVYHFGSVPGLGNAATLWATDIAASPSGFGYWVVDADGHVYAFGDAASYGNATGLLPGEIVTAISRTASGKGYWLFTTRGRVFRFGDALSYGDLRNKVLNGPVFDAVATPSGKGYYMVGSDGGVFSFGDAKYHGSMGGAHVTAPVRTLVPDPDGVGYWLVGIDGAVYSFDAAYHGSMHGVKLNKPIVGMVSNGYGYLMVAADGGIFNFSNKPYFGSLGGNPPAIPIVSVAAFA